MRRAYDHRIHELVCTTGDVTLARRLGVPERTERSWLRRGRREVVSLDDGDDGGAGAHALRLAEAESRIALLELRLRRLRAVVHRIRCMKAVLFRFGAAPHAHAHGESSAVGEAGGGLARERADLRGILCGQGLHGRRAAERGAHARA